MSGGQVVILDVIDPRDRGRIEPMIVAALVNGNDTVGVIDAVSDDATGGWDGR